MFQLTRREKAEVVTNCDHLRRLKYSALQQVPSGISDGRGNAALHDALLAEPSQV
jgi:hypothetical protein